MDNTTLDQDLEWCQGCAAKSGNFSKDRYPYLGIFLKKVPIFCDYATKTHQTFKIFQKIFKIWSVLVKILKIRPI